MSDKDSDSKPAQKSGQDDGEPDLIDRSTADLGEYAESSTREPAKVVGKTAHADDADPAEVPERDDTEAPD